MTDLKTVTLERTNRQPVAIYEPMKFRIAGRPDERFPEKFEVSIPAQALKQIGVGGKFFSRDEYILARANKRPVVYSDTMKTLRECLWNLDACNRPRDDVFFCNPSYMEACFAVVEMYPRGREYFETRRGVEVTHALRLHSVKIQLQEDAWEYLAKQQPGWYFTKR